MHEVAMFALDEKCYWIAYCSL